MVPAGVWSANSRGQWPQKLRTGLLGRPDLRNRFRILCAP